MKLSEYPERFQSKVDLSESGCWEWTGSRDKLGGYGRIKWERRPAWAHRIAYMLAHGPIAEGMEIDHLCRNRRCVNPSHLEAVTARVNMHRSEATLVNRRRAAAQSHCWRGHPLSGSNLRITATGSRRCAECTRINSRERYRRSRLV